jgi:hypothetical protein
VPRTLQSVGRRLPQKLTLTGNFDSASGSPYNVLTALDNNGDGNFNNRLLFAHSINEVASMHLYRTLSLIPLMACATALPAQQCKGSALTGTVRDIVGTMPWTIHLDMNLSRSFTLNPHSAEHKTLAVNLRSANILNHTNVTLVGNTLGSPLFGIPYAADASRRVELGIRYSF